MSSTCFHSLLSSCSQLTITLIAVSVGDLAAVDHLISGWRDHQQLIEDSEQASNRNFFKTN